MKTLEKARVNNIVRRLFDEKDLYFNTQTVPAEISSCNANAFSHAGDDQERKIHLLFSQFRSPVETLTFELPGEYCFKQNL